MAVPKKTTAPKIKKESAISLKVLSASATKTTMVVSSAIFAVSASPKLLSAYVRVFMDRARSSRASAKDRSEVTGSGRKIYRQKGTGRARHGDRQAPIFVGGGKAHGPKAVSHILSINKKQRQKALLYALSLKRQDDALYVAPGLDDMTGKTREIMPILGQIKENNGKILIVSGEKDREMIFRAVANVVGASGASAETLNAYEVLSSSSVVFSKSGLDLFTSLREKKS